MNFLFDEDDQTQDASMTQQVPSRKRRTVPSDGSSVQRTRRTESARPAQRQRSSAQERSSSPKVRQLDANSVSGGRSAQPRTNRQVSARSMDAESDLFQTQALLAASAQPKQVDSETSQQPRKVVPKEAQPRQAQPRQAQPKQQQPRQAQPKQSRSASGNRTQSQTDSEVRSAKRRSVSESGAAQAHRRSASENGAAQAQRRSVSENGAAQAQRRSASENGAAQAQRRSADHEQELRRINRSDSGRSGGSGRKRGGKKRASGFKKFLIIYAAFLLVVLIVGMIIFGSFLGRLEASQPSNIASDIAANFSADKVSSYLSKNKELINCFGEPDDLIAATAENVAGAEKISYIENKDYRADAPSYNITADGETVAKITLEKAGSGSFGLSNWKVSELDIADYLDTTTYEFLAPVGTTITINGTELDEKFLTGEEGIPEMLQTAAKYVKIPSFLTYKVAGIAGTPEIKAKDASGNDLKMTVTDDKYVIGAETTQEFIDSVKPLVENAIEAWGKHFINMGGNLSAYMLEGSDWYSYIFGGPDMDPILTAFYEYESIADYAFTEKSADNYIKFTDDCFTVDVSYKMRVDFTTDQMSDDNQKLDATWVFISQNGGKDWYIIDCIYKS